MDTSMNGRKIAMVTWPDMEDADDGPYLESKDGCEIYLSATHHGDHDEFWVVQGQDGVEVARHNIKFISTIKWA